MTCSVLSLAGSGDDAAPRPTPPTRGGRRDALTGLPDRDAFVDRLALVLSAASRLGSAVAVLVLDLDGFKLVNHALGHAVGDRLLVDVAQRLRGCVSPETLVARLGGDEFAVLLDDVVDPDQPARVATCLIDALRPPFAVGGRETFVTASVGVAASAPHRAEPDDLIREADTALYRAKATGRDAYYIYAPGMHAPAVARLERETALRRAVDREELSVEYQPMVELTSGRIVGVEALLRWRRPGGDVVQPDEFIGLAEETELIGPMGHWILREACRQARSWQDGMDDPPVVSVNLSARQLARPSLTAEVAGALAESGLNPRRLELEVTESIAMSTVHGSWATLRGLRQIGVRLAIDDFGTGYSSFDHLRRLAPDTLKLDRAFVVGLDDAVDTLPIVRAVTTMAHELGVVVTAEGIETAAQAARLRSLGIARGQGYLFAPPMAGERIGPFLGEAVSEPFGPFLGEASSEGVVAEDEG